MLQLQPTPRALELAPAAPEEDWLMTSQGDRIEQLMLEQNKKIDRIAEHLYREIGTGVEQGKSADKLEARVQTLEQKRVKKLEDSVKELHGAIRATRLLFGALLALAGLAAAYLN